MSTVESLVLKTQIADLPPEKSVPRLRVCHLSMTLLTGGLERLLVDYGRFHNADDFELCFAALEDLGPPADDLREAGYEITTLDMPNIGKWGAIQKLKEYLTEQRIDILHTHNTYPYFYGVFAAKLAGIKTVINTQHGRGCGPNLKSRLQFRIANKLANRVLGVSEDAAELCRQQDRSSAIKIQCIWNGIDLDRFQYHGPHDSLSAISVARLSKEKDFATLLKAVRFVVDQYPDFQLRMVGDGAERAALEVLTTELNLTNNVEFLGERKDVPELLRTAGFFVSSSTTEGISLTLLEAMAVGLPIVTTSVGGNPEIVVEGVTGKLCPPREPKQLANKIVAMIEDRPVWPDIGVSARERVEQHFNIRTMIKNYESLYKELAIKS